jgi:hypothetical protein
MSQGLLVVAVQVLAVNIFALVRHAAAPQNLLRLRELHVDMVGSMEGSCIDPGGLPCLPHLTKLVMTIDTKVSTIRSPTAIPCSNDVYSMTQLSATQN